MSSTSLIHVADPMCSWCYAFSPELDKIVDATGLEVRLVMGGLFVGERTLELDNSLRGYLRETWARVQDLSGRPVAFDLPEWETWTYDTELACRAVVAVRESEPNMALVVFDRLQTAFYAENLDLTNPDIVTAVIREACPTVDIEHALADTSTCARDFAEARELGATGFPTLLLDTGAEKIIVSPGFHRADRAIRTIRVLTGGGRMSQETMRPDAPRAT